MSAAIELQDPTLTKKRVMFVDDEEQVLSGIRILLRRRRQEWDMAFLKCGAKAIEALNESPVDVIISDMRMPGIDGLQLLTYVKQHHPRTVRIILSGFSERASALQLVPVAHQFLAKPCDADILRDTVRSACELHSLINNPRLGRMVGRLSHLPSAPGMYTKVLEVTSKLDFRVSDLSDILKQDTGLAAKLLNIVNSAFFGQAKPTSDLTRATMLLGVTNIRELVLGFQSFQQFSANEDRCGLRIDQESRHGCAVGQLARAIALKRGLGVELAGAAMTAGLLHHIGRLVIAVNDPDVSLQLVQKASKLTESRRSLESAALGVTSTEIGACLLSMWGIPYPIVEGVAYHESPTIGANPGFSVAGAVHVASALLADPKQQLVEVDAEFGRAHGIGEDLNAWQSEFAEVLKKI